MESRNRKSHSASREIGSWPRGSSWALRNRYSRLAVPAKCAEVAPAVDRVVPETKQRVRLANLAFRGSPPDQIETRCRRQLPGLKWPLSEAAARHHEGKCQQQQGSCAGQRCAHGSPICSLPVFRGPPEILACAPETQKPRPGLSFQKREQGL